MINNKKCYFCKNIEGFNLCYVQENTRKVWIVKVWLLYWGGIPPVAAHLCWSVDTIAGRLGLLDRTLSISSMMALVNFGRSWNIQEVRHFKKAFRISPGDCWGAWPCGPPCWRRARHTGWWRSWWPRPQPAGPETRPAAQQPEIRG